MPVVGNDVEDLTAVDYLFWVGCAGAYDDRAQKTTRAVAELLHTAGVSFAVLGDGETCTGDPARRAGNEFLFQMLAQANVEVLGEAKAGRIVVTCAHCFNTLTNEYPQLGGQYEVIHHTQLLNRLVRDRRLVPLARPDRADSTGVASTAATVTYHDPCYLGRHNGVYAPPRELLGALPGVELKEMPRNSERSFCCGAGGARMWMEEKLGTRINATRTAEAVATGAERIAIGCPFCRVMLSDGLSAAQADGSAPDAVEVVDVAQMLLAAVRPAPATRPPGCQHHDVARCRPGADNRPGLGAVGGLGAAGARSRGVRRLGPPGRAGSGTCGWCPWPNLDAGTTCPGAASPAPRSASSCAMAWLLVSRTPSVIAAWARGSRVRPRSTMASSSQGISLSVAGSQTRRELGPHGGEQVFRCHVRDLARNGRTGHDDTVVVQLEPSDGGQPPTAELAVGPRRPLAVAVAICRPPGRGSATGRRPDVRGPASDASR